MSSLVPFGPEIWIAEGPVVSFYGFPYPTRSVIIRLAEGRLFVWSPIALTPELRTNVEQLGKPAYLVSPNAIHHLFLGDWKRAYPGARLYASPGLAKKRRDLTFDATLGDTPEHDWAMEIDQVEMAGSLFLTEVVFFHRASRTVIFADLIENFPQSWFSGWRGWLARLDGITEADPGAPREWRASFWNRSLARTALNRILGWHAEQVVVAHGTMVRNDATAFIQKAFRWLSK
ncbi:MAG TPA: DUF4336 domain-containing protein [Rhizomicrobium sp.]|nr:DUF4336 domain-containing protein [Rhizomicrobium sp.]